MFELCHNQKHLSNKEKEMVQSNSLIGISQGKWLPF